VDGVDDICYKCIKGGEFERVRELEGGTASARWKKVHACLLHQKRSASRTCPIFSKIS
jgi:hypothetical protein